MSTICLRATLVLMLPLAWYSVPCMAAVYHVAAGWGDDTASGLSQEAAWRHLQFAVDRVIPGDTVLVHPGVYFEHIKLERGGTKDFPIVFRGLGGVDAKPIVTGARRDIYSGEASWKCENPAIGLYSIPHPEEPATVLADKINLYRYASLAELTTFRVANVALSGKPAPGPRHGFAWSDGKLYVRLHASRYGNSAPTGCRMKVSPARGQGFRGDEIDSRVRANWSVLTDEPAMVTLERFAFESPGFCGVWVRRGGVTVRECQFVGCRTGVRGWDRAEKKPRQLSDDVIVERCEFSEYPSYHDVAEIVTEAEKLDESEQRALPPFFWWHRKGGPYSGEIGLVTAAGRRWIIRDNHVHDTLDGLSFMSLGWSEDAQVIGNRFERIIDNAVEAENHAQRLLVRGNTVVDAFEPFSYQPLDGEPWPGSIHFDRNLVIMTPEFGALWQKPIVRWQRGCFKIRVDQGLRRIPGEGLRATHNLLDFPHGNLFSINAAAVPIEGVTLDKNIIVCQDLGGTDRGQPPTAITFEDNEVYRLAERGTAESDAAWKLLERESRSIRPDELGITWAADGTFHLVPDGRAARTLDASR
jgi:hypothetical protein